MKKRLVLFAFACIACLALFTCENQQVIGILKDLSELDWLEVTAYAGEYAMPGGSAVEPGFRPSVFEYTAYVDKDTTHFVINAGIDDKGTVVVYSDQVTGDAATLFDLLGDEVVMTLKVTRQYMETAEYRVTVIRGEPVPTAKDVVISVEPGIGAFFIGAGVLPTIKVTAVPPDTGVALNYQWYVNDQNNTRTGNPITNAEGDSYTMQAIETITERSVYYYVEITSVFEGKTGITQSAPCRVTFLNKNDLDPRSYAMADIPAGNVTVSQWNSSSFSDWSTPGFKMGRNVVTWELWETVFKYADAANYRFGREGNQGAAYFLPGNNPQTTNNVAQPIGNRLNPVTAMSWRDAVVWCNAYSEMDGLEPVYRDSNGGVLRDSRKDVDVLLDFDAVATAGYNGYRLPTYEEWNYAARGANPTGAYWNNYYPGTNSNDLIVLGKYLWCFSPELAANGGAMQTTEVGKRLPNQLWNGISYVDGLYDMKGMVGQWFDWSLRQQTNKETYATTTDIIYVFGSSINNAIEGFGNGAPVDIVPYNCHFVGLRIARNREGE